MVLEGSMKTLKLFGEQSCQVFYELKRCVSKNAVLRNNTKASKSVPEATKRKVAENPHRFDHLEAKYVRIPMFVHIPRALEQGQICIYGFIRKTWLGKKFLRF